MKTIKHSLVSTLTLVIYTYVTVFTVDLSSQCVPPSGPPTLVGNPGQFISALTNHSTNIQIANNTTLNITLTQNYTIAVGKVITLPASSNLVIDGANNFSLSNACNTPTPTGTKLMGGGFNLEGGNLTLKNIKIKDLDNFLFSAASLLGGNTTKRSIILDNVDFENCNNTIFIIGNLYNWIKIINSKFEWNNNFIPYVNSMNNPSFHFPSHILIDESGPNPTSGNVWITGTSFINNISNTSHQSQHRGTGLDIVNIGLYAGKRWCSETMNNPPIPNPPSCPQLCGDGNKFINLFKGVVSKQNLNQSSQVEISNNEFQQCYQGITCESDFNNFIYHNKIQFDGSSNIEETLYGIRIIECKHYNVSYNELDVICVRDVCQGIELIDCDDVTNTNPPQIEIYASKVYKNTIHYHGINGTGTTHLSCSNAIGGYYSNAAIGIASYGYNLGADIQCNTFDLNLIGGGCPNSDIQDFYISNLPNVALTSANTVRQQWGSGISPNVMDAGNIFLRNATTGSYGPFGFSVNLPSPGANQINYYYKSSIPNSEPTNNIFWSNNSSVTTIPITSIADSNLCNESINCLRLEGSTTNTNGDLFQLPQKEKSEGNTSAILIESENDLIAFKQKYLAEVTDNLLFFDNLGNQYSKFEEIKLNGLYFFVSNDLNSNSFKKIAFFLNLYQ
jgi:hypothetical protein